MLLREYLQTKHGISRRKFTQLVDEYKILVDGGIINSYKHQVQSNCKLQITDGKLQINETLNIEKKKSKSVIVLFNKPVGYVVSKSDPYNKTIYEILPKEFAKYYYIGRLDKDSHGLLLLTNDPKLVNEYEHPKYEIEKEYVVTLNKVLNSADIKKMKEGIVDSGEKLQIKQIYRLTDGQRFRIVLTEGKKRQIRRMFSALRYHVDDLQRICEGKFELGTLKLGECRIQNSDFGT